MTENATLALLSDQGSIQLTEEIYQVLLKKIPEKEILPFNKEDLYLNRFKNGETEVKIKRNMRNKKVFLVKSFNVIQEKWKDQPGQLKYDPQSGYIELFTINDALKRTSAAQIIDVLPYMAYQRQDKKDEPRVPITAKLMAKLTEASGANRVLTVDPHVKQIQGFYEISFDDLKSSVLFAEYFEKNLPEIKEKGVIVSPDLGGNRRAKELAEMLGLPIAVVYKMRPKPGEAKTLGLLKEEETNLEGKIVVLFDDIIDSGGSIINAVKKLREEKVGRIYACCSHPIFCGEAKEKLKKEDVEVITTNSILIDDLKNYPNIKVVSLSFVLAEAIHSIYTGHSISQSLFEYKKYKEEKEKYGL